MPQMHDDYRAVCKSDIHCIFVKWMNQRWIGMTKCHMLVSQLAYDMINFPDLHVFSNKW